MDIANFGRMLVEHYLRERRLVYLVGGDGEFCVKFANTERTAVTAIFFSMEGPDGNIAVVRGRGSVDFAPDQHARLTEFADEWNRTRRWPKAYTVVGADGAPEVVGECSWLMDSEFPSELFDRWMTLVVDAVVTLFEELTARPLSPTAAELDSWLLGRR
ncbi:YbjN domain-containing protein [Mycobacterium sp. pR1184]|uniref:YbjN domain-containing protein n=1 Tax=Mycobacterium sp. pR1184 TaxID=3238981 RepID=UPI00351AC179